MTQTMHDRRMWWWDRVMERRVSDFLVEHHFGSARRVSVAVEAGVVRLRGEVASRYARQLILAGCRHVPGVKTVVDELALASEVATAREVLAPRYVQEKPAGADGRSSEGCLAGKRC